MTDDQLMEVWVASFLKEVAVMDDDTRHSIGDVTDFEGNVWPHYQQKEIIKGYAYKPDIVSFAEQELMRRETKCEINR